MKNVLLMMIIATFLCCQKEAEPSLLCSFNFKDKSYVWGGYCTDHDQFLGTDFGPAVKGSNGHLSLEIHSMECDYDYFGKIYASKFQPRITLQLGDTLIYQSSGSKYAFNYGPAPSVSITGGFQWDFEGVLWHTTIKQDVNGGSINFASDSGLIKGRCNCQAR